MGVGLRGARAHATHRELQTTSNGLIAGKDAAPFFKKSGLDVAVLKSLWELLDDKKTGAPPYSTRPYPPLATGAARLEIGPE